MDLQLNGKVALITGGRQGIGKGVVLGLAAEGTNVAFCDIKEEGVKEVLDEVNKLGVEGMFVRADVTDFDQVQGMVNRVLEKFGTVDILVNNAGTVEEIPFHKSTPRVWDLDIRTSLVGALNCCRAVIEHMMQQRSGRIVNISSIAAQHMGPRFTAYSAAKAGMIGLTRSLAVEYGRYGIGTNAVGPGFTLTELAMVIKQRDKELEEGLTAEALEERRRWQRYHFPMGRWNEVEDVVTVVILLASSSATRFVNGECIMIDGGFTKVA